MCVERLTDKEAGLRANALEMIKTEVAGATSSMSSVPKPLKFMTPLYEKLVEIFDNYKTEDKFKRQLANLCSVIGMVAAKDDSNDMLTYCLKGELSELHHWGHEYLRSMAGQLGLEYNKRVEKSESYDEIYKIVDIIIPHFIDHNEEPEAVDLMMETESLEKLIQFTNERNYERVCRYLTACSQYAADTEEMHNSYKTAFDIYKSQKQFCDALRVAQKMNNNELISEIMEACEDEVTKKQMAFMLGRQRNPYESDNDEINTIIAQEKLSEYYKQLARDLDQMEPKHPDAIFKTHLEERKVGEAQLDSAKQNLAKTYVNAFVNAGLGNDLLICKKEGTDDWVFSNKDEGQMAAAASLGLL